MRRVDPAFVVILAGVSAALHVGKLPTALPVLREAFALTLVQAGFLISLVQFGGMTLGLAVGLAADGVGLRRCMVGGLVLLFAAGGLGGWAQDANTLLALRALEGCGLLLATIPAPSLIRQLVVPQRMNATLGLWGAYMPFGTAAALVSGPFAMAAAGWQAWWWALALLSLAMAVWVCLAVPADRLRTAAGGQTQPVAAGHLDNWPQRLRQTLSARGPWLVALTFAMYSGQWLAVVGFLPSIYAQAGLSAGVSGVLTALAAVVNMAGNIVSGRLLQRGWRPEVLLCMGFGAMGFGSLAAFALVAGSGLPAVPRYLAVLLFSMVGGMIPGTLFSLAVLLAPSSKTVSTTVGWMQQWSALGQFAGPPVVAWVAAQAGGWQWTWVATGLCAVAGGALAHAIGTMLRQRGQISVGPSR